MVNFILNILIKCIVIKKACILKLEFNRNSCITNLELALVKNWLGLRQLIASLFMVFLISANSFNCGCSLKWRSLVPKKNCPFYWDIGFMESIFSVKYSFGAEAFARCPIFTIRFKKIPPWNHVINNPLNTLRKTSTTSTIWSTKIFTWYM